MLEIQIILLIGLLSVASLASPALQKQFFFLSSYGTLSNQLFQTRNGIIAYTIDELNVNSNLELVPTYLLIDLENKNVTPILSGLTTACEQGPSLFNKLHYHVATYSLIYYCSVNNTVMLLDEDDYTVQKTIPLNITEIFQEVRIITEGYSIAILGLQGLLSETPAPSHLIKISLQSKEVISHVIFDHGLAFGEAVTAYASNDKNLYALTNTLNDTAEATTVYLMTLIGNSYNLTLLANFTYVFDNYSETLVNELYCVDNLVITNNYDSLIIMNQQGSVLQTIENLSMKPATGNSTSYWRSQLNSEYGSSDFYAIWSNDTLVKFSALKGGYTSESIGKANSMQLAVKNQGSNTLLFTLSLDDVSSGGNFTITDLETSKIIYQSVASLYDMMITNSTYCVVQEEGVGLTFSIFDLETDTILKIIPIAPYQNEYYYDQQNHVISYVKGFRNGTHQVMQIDLLTGDVYGFETFNFPVYMMQGTNNANFDAPQFVLNVENQSYDYLIISQTFGRIDFTPINVNDVDDLLVDYDTLQIYYFTANETTNVNIVDVYIYDTQTKNFILQNSMTNDDVSPAFFYPEQKYTVAWEQGRIAVIELPSLQESNYSVSWDYGSVSLLQGAPGIQFVISQSYGTSQTQPATLYVNGTMMTLSGSNNYTMGAGAASPCSYWVENGVLANMVVVSVYNMCSQDIISI